MLSQHLITKPLFDALFENYSFTSHTQVSASLDAVVELLEDHFLEKEIQPLEKLYESVRKRAKGIDNPEGRQRIVI
jgi:predicted helicase